MRILAISSSYGLFKPSSGARSRFYNITQQLIENGSKVWVLQPLMNKHLRDASVAETHYFRNGIANKTLAMLGDFNPFFIVSLFRILASIKPHIVQVSSPFGVIASSLVTKLFSQRSLVVYDAHNVESDMYSLGSRHFFEKSFVSVYCLWQEKLSVRFADHIIAVSETDRKRFISKFKISPKKVTLIPSGVEPRVFNYQKLNESESKKPFTIVFHGSYHHHPNKKAVEALRNYVAPKVKESCEEDVVFLLAGDGMPVFQDDNLVSLGFMEDIYNFLSKANLAVVPITCGGGTRLKLLDYMALALPIVTTKKGIEGILAVNGEHALITNSIDEAFIQSIIQLIHSESLCQTLGANARKLATEKYCWTTIGSKLHKLYEQMCGDSQQCGV